MFLTLRCALYSWFSTNFWCNSIYQVPDVAEVPGFQVTFPLDVAWCTWWFKNLSVPGFRIGNSDWFPTLLNNCFLCGEIAEIYLCISVGVSFYIILNRNFYKLYPNIRRSYPWKWPWKIYGLNIWPFRSRLSWDWWEERGIVSLLCNFGVISSYVEWSVTVFHKYISVMLFFVLVYVPNDRQWVKGTPALGWYLTGVSPHGSLEGQPDVPVPLLVSD